MPKRKSTPKPQVKSRVYEVLNSEGQMFMSTTTRVSSRREARKQAEEEVAMWNRHKPGYSYRMVE